ncbi:hypothetical protein C8R47DRAFT_1223970 [Mycena vitilis]|nr:hypothetical protein C8R47DRAFT_1223970 [Mycena vitilis]
MSSDGPVPHQGHCRRNTTLTLRPSPFSTTRPPPFAPSHRARQPSTVSQTGGLRRFRRRLYRAWVALNEFMTVPLWAALASLIVACVQPLQHALDAHMQPVKGAVTSAGNCSIPLTLIVLGGYVYPAPPEPSAAAANGTANGAERLGIKSSNSATSLLESVREMFGKQQAARRTGTVTATRLGETKTVVIALTVHSPVSVVSKVLLVSSPPALTLAQITQAASGDAFERLISRTIFWAYCVVTPPATVAYVVIGLLLSKL